MLKTVLAENETDGNHQNVIFGTENEKEFRSLSHNPCNSIGIESAEFGIVTFL